MNITILSAPREQESWIYLYHTNPAKKCERCKASPRPVCPSCGHSLSAEVEKLPEGKQGRVLCEVCRGVYLVDMKDIV